MARDPALHLSGAKAAARQARGAVTLWLAAAALALVFVPLFALFDAGQNDVLGLQSAVVAAQSARVALVPAEELVTLQSSAADMVAADEALHAAIARATYGGVPWAAVLQRAIPSPASEIHLTSLTQTEDRLVIQGVAANEPALTAYVERLRGTLLFDDLQAESATLSFTVSLRVKDYEP